MSRAPRRQFLAPFILTAAVALPGCKSKGGNTTVIKDDPPTSARSWSVWASADGNCEADDNTSYDCPPDATCNPPPPMMVACPEGMTEDQVTITQAEADGPCTMEAADGAVEVGCPEELPDEEEELPDDPEEPLED